jgi:hypothetical protein
MNRVGHSMLLPANQLKLCIGLMWGGQSWQPILAAAAFLGGQSRLKAGCGQNCPPHKVQVAQRPYSLTI